MFSDFFRFCQDVIRKGNVHLFRQKLAVSYSFKFHE